MKQIISFSSVATLLAAGLTNLSDRHLVGTSAESLQITSVYLITQIPLPHPSLANRHR